MGSILAVLKWCPGVYLNYSLYLLAIFRLNFWGWRQGRVIVKFRDPLKYGVTQRIDITAKALDLTWTYRK